MKTGENGHFEFLGQKVKILAFSHKKLFKNVILIIGNYTNDIRSKNFKKSNISGKIWYLILIVGQFGTGQFGTGQFDTRTIWHQHKKNGQLGTKKKKTSQL